MGNETEMENEKKEYRVICWASEEFYVEACSEEEAKQIAAQQCQFPYVDYFE